MLRESGISLTRRSIGKGKSVLAILPGRKSSRFSPAVSWLNALNSLESTDNLRAYRFRFPVIVVANIYYGTVITSNISDARDNEHNKSLLGCLMARPNVGSEMKSVGGKELSRE